MNQISIIYEDENIVVINKPSGIISHPKNLEDAQYSVSRWFTENYPNSKNVGEPLILPGGKEVPKPGIAHRLDKDTSGLMILVKTKKAYIYFKEQFKARTISKYYLALVHGRPKDPKGAILSPLGRIGTKRTTRIIGNKLIDKKEALTEYKTIKSYKDFTLLEVSPKTGRTHQIRVHLNSINNPVAGDPIYGPSKLPSPPGLNRLFLHAYKLEFTTQNGKRLILECDPPQDLQNIINELK